MEVLSAHYPEPQPQYLWRKDSDVRIYIDYVHNQLREVGWRLLNRENQLRS